MRGPARGGDITGTAEDFQAEINKLRADAKQALKSGDAGLRSEKIKRARELQKKVKLKKRPNRFNKTPKGGRGFCPIVVPMDVFRRFLPGFSDDQPDA